MLIIGQAQFCPNKLIISYMDCVPRIYHYRHARLQCIVMCIGPNQKNQPNLNLYLVRRHKICHYPIVVSYLFIGKNQKNQPNLVLYLVRRSKIFVSVAPLASLPFHLFHSSILDHWWNRLLGLRRSDSFWQPKRVGCRLRSWKGRSICCAVDPAFILPYRDSIYPASNLPSADWMV